MATVINNPTPTENSSSPFVLIIGLLLFAALIFLFFYYGLPALRQSARSQVPQINVPSEIDVNIKPVQ